MVASMSARGTAPYLRKVKTLSERFADGSGEERVDGRQPDESGDDISDALGLEALVWVVICREGPITMVALESRIRRQRAVLRPVIDRLVRDGRARRVEQQSDEILSAPDFNVPLAANSGWEAAVLDHFQAVVTTICQRLSLGAQVPGAQEGVGGSTYTFNVWRGHPLEDEVLDSLRRFRAEQGDLRRRVREHNEAHPPPGEYDEVIVYGGQCSVPRSMEEHDDV